MLNLPDSRTAEFRLCASTEILVLSYQGHNSSRDIQEILCKVCKLKCYSAFKYILRNICTSGKTNMREGQQRPLESWLKSEGETVVAHDLHMHFSSICLNYTAAESYTLLFLHLFFLCPMTYRYVKTLYFFIVLLSYFSFLMSVLTSS